MATKKKTIKKKSVKFEIIDREVFVDGHKLLDSDVEKLKRAVFTHLFNGVTEDDILRVHNGVYVYKGRALNIDHLKAIKEEARMLQKSELLQTMLNELRNVANKRMYQDSQTINDLLAGKMMLYNIEVLEKKIKILSEMKT